MQKFYILLSLLLSATLFGASNPTPNYWKCYNKVGGSWDYGRVPNACDVAPFGDATYVTNTFSPIIFDDFKDRSSEKKRYIDSMVPLIRDASTYYLHVRNPSASALEQESWANAILAVSHQESFMTHYRIASDARLKMIRGDYGHGHGMMQIDDRWHFTEINEGKGWQIFQNITYALEIYYDAWLQASNASCVHTFYEQSRSAYSIYNGGASKECRWTNPNDTWAQNDKNFKAKLDTKAWENWIDDLNAPSSLNVECFMQGNEQCGTQEITDSSLLKVNNSKYCILIDNALECVENQIDAFCLTQKFETPITTSLLSLSKEQSDEYTQTTHERTICQENITNLFKIGESLKPQKDITLRDTPAGTAIGSVHSGDVYQVLDFEVRNDVNEYRYYKVQSANQIGYIYAGKESDNSSWSIKANHNELSTIIIPQANDNIEIVSTLGINMRESAGGALITNIPNATLLHVKETLVIGSSNNVYYQVAYEGAVGYIYGGQLLPKNTLTSWAKYTTQSTYSSSFSSLSSSSSSTSSLSSLTSSSSSVSSVSSQNENSSLSSSNASSSECEKDFYYSNADEKCVAVISQSTTDVKDESLSDSIYSTLSNLYDDISFENIYTYIDTFFDFDALYELFMSSFGDLYDYISEYTVIYLEDNSTQIDVTTAIPDDGITF